MNFTSDDRSEYCFRLVDKDTNRVTDRCISPQPDGSVKVEDELTFVSPLQAPNVQSWLDAMNADVRVYRLFQAECTSRLEVYDPERDDEIHIVRPEPIGTVFDSPPLSKAREIAGKESITREIFQRRFAHGGVSKPGALIFWVWNKDENLWKFWLGISADEHKRFNEEMNKIGKCRSHKGTRNDDTTVFHREAYRAQDEFGNKGLIYQGFVSDEPKDEFPLGAELYHRLTQMGLQGYQNAPSTHLIKRRRG